MKPPTCRCGEKIKALQGVVRRSDRKLVESRAKESALKQRIKELEAERGR